MSSLTKTFTRSESVLTGNQQSIITPHRKFDESEKPLTSNTSQERPGPSITAEASTCGSLSSPLQPKAPGQSQKQDQQSTHHDPFDYFWPSRRLLRGNTSDEELAQRKVLLGRPSERLKMPATRLHSIAQIPERQTLSGSSRRNEYDQYERQQRVDRLIPSETEGKEKQDKPLKNQLEFKVCRTDDRGRTVSEKWYLDLNEAAQEASETAQAPQIPLKTPPAVRRMPSENSLRPCFDALYEEHQTVRKLVKELKEELENWILGKKRLPPQTPVFENDSDISTESEMGPGMDHDGKTSAQHKERRKRLARKRRKTAKLKDEDNLKDHIIEDQEKKIKQMERHEHDCELTYYSLQAGFKKCQNDLSDERRANHTMETKIAELTNEVRELRDESDPLRDDLMRLKDNLSDAKLDIIELSRELKDSETDAQQKLDNLRRQLERLQDDNRVLQDQRNHLITTVVSAVADFKQASERQSQWRAHCQFRKETKATKERASSGANISSQLGQELEQLKQKYAEVECQRNRLMEMAFRSVTSLRDASQRQSRRRAYFQFQVETEMLEKIDSTGLFTQSSDQFLVPQLTAPSNSIGTNFTTSTWERITRLRPSQVVDASVPEHLQRENHQIRSWLSEKRTKNLTTRSKSKPRTRRPAPIAISLRAAKPIGQAYRSPRSPNHYEKLGTRLPAAANAETISTPLGDAWEEIPPASPGYFASQDALLNNDKTIVSSGLTPLYEEAAKWPIHFDDEAKILYDIIGVDRDRKPQAFRHDDTVKVSVKPGNFWLVQARHKENAVPCYLPRTALAEVCRHGFKYKQNFKVVGPLHQVWKPEQDEGGCIIVTAGEAVVSAHANNAPPSSFELGCQYHCVKSLYTYRKGYVRAELLTEVRRGKVAALDISSRECPCTEPRPYTGQARILQDCYGSPGNFKLKEGDVVEVAHTNHGPGGFTCVRQAQDGWQGFVEAILLSMVRHPQQFSLGDDELYGDVTPRFFQIQERGWFEGEKSSIYTAMNEGFNRKRGTAPFSDAAKKCWENNNQGTNPRLKKWKTAYAESSRLQYWHPWTNGVPPPGPYYIIQPDHFSLPPVLKDTLAVNPLGPLLGKRRARARSLITVTKPELRLIKHGPDIGYQPLSDPKNDKCRGYESEPDRRKASSKVRKYIFRKTETGKSQVIDAANEFSTEQMITWLQNEYHAHPYGNEFTYWHGKRTHLLEENRRKFPWNGKYAELAKIQHRRYRSHLLWPEVRSKPMRPVNQATYAIENIFKRGYTVVYRVSAQALSQYDPPFHEDDWLAVDRDNSRDPDGNQDDVSMRLVWNSGPKVKLTNDRRLLKAEHLRWKQPFLCTARVIPNIKYLGAKAKSETTLILLGPSEGTAEWDCIDDGVIRSIDTKHLEFLSPDWWARWDDVLSRNIVRHAYTAWVMEMIGVGTGLTKDEIPFAVNSTFPADSDWLEWEWIFPVVDSFTTPDGTVLHADEWMYMPPDGLRLDHFQCTTFGANRLHHIPRSIVDWQRPHLPMIIPEENIGCAQDNWVLFLKTTEAGRWCKFPDGYIAHVVFEDLTFGVDGIRYVSVTELFEKGFLRIPDAEHVSSSPKSASVDSWNTERFEKSAISSVGDDQPLIVQQLPENPGSTFVPSKNVRDSQFITGLDKFGRNFDPQYSQVVEHDLHRHDSLVEEFGLPTATQPLRIVRKADDYTIPLQRQSSVPLSQSQSQAVPATDGEDVPATTKEPSLLVSQELEIEKKRSSRLAEVHGNQEAQGTTKTTVLPSRHMVQRGACDTSIKSEVEDVLGSERTESRNAESENPTSAGTVTDEHQKLIEEFNRHKRVCSAAFGNIAERLTMCYRANKTLNHSEISNMIGQLNILKEMTDMTKLSMTSKASP